MQDLNGNEVKSMSAREFFIIAELETKEKTRKKVAEIIAQRTNLDTKTSEDIASEICEITEKEKRSAIWSIVNQLGAIEHNEPNETIREALEECEYTILEEFGMVEQLPKDVKAYYVNKYGIVGGNIDETNNS